MSIYYFKNQYNREVQYGLDLPTGGYYYNEFCREDESKDEALFSYSDGMTFTELERVLYSRFKFTFKDKSDIFYNLVSEFATSPKPTRLQYNVSTMFGKNLGEMLLRVYNDLADRFPLETKGEL